VKTRRPSPDDLIPGLETELPGASARAPISIRDLTATIRELLEENLDEIWVAGEISNFRAPGSGHLYFTLKDETATLAAVMFRSDAARIGFALQDGQAVIARGSITVYESRGQYQLQVAEVRARGQGGLQQRFEELKRRLAAENLFALERKRPLPVFPERIGIVTSLQGAVLQDMLQILQRRAPGIRIFVRGVRVQGAGSAVEIAEAIAAFSAENKVDLLVVARGGGSLEDLWSFNEEVVARALAACGVPTISAVGHETDFTIADFVADLRAPTPSAAAELLTRDWNEWRQVVAERRARLERIVRQAIIGHRRHLTRLGASPSLREPRRVVRQWAQRLDDLREELRSAMDETIRERWQALGVLAARLQLRQPARELERRRQHLAHLAARLRTLGPQGTLDRGYALVLDAAGHPLTRVKKQLEGRSVRVVLGKGVVGANLTEAQPEKTLLEALAPESSSETSSPVKKSGTRKKKSVAKGPKP
jgi:exodeoxyribonuclease VII large subunit